MSTSFTKRHIGPWGHARQELLDTIGNESLDTLVDRVDNVHGDRNLDINRDHVDAYAQS